jgi:hypothetical protein
MLSGPLRGGLTHQGWLWSAPRGSDVFANVGSEGVQLVSDRVVFRVLNLPKRSRCLNVSRCDVPCLGKTVAVDRAGGQSEARPLLDRSVLVRW